MCESSALENDAFDDVGDVFALVDGGLDDFEDLFPLDDLDGVFFFVEKLGDEGAAETVAIVFVAVDLDAVLEGFFGRFEGADGGFDFGGGGDKDFHEINSACAHGVHAIKDETAGAGLHQIDHNLQAAATLVKLFAIERREKG